MFACFVNFVALTCKKKKTQWCIDWTLLGRVCNQYEIKSLFITMSKYWAYGHGQGLQELYISAAQGLLRYIKGTVHLKCIVLSTIYPLISKTFKTDFLPCNTKAYILLLIMSRCCFLDEVQRCFILVLFRYYYSIYHYLKFALILCFQI